MLSHCTALHCTCGVLACHRRLVLRRLELSLGGLELSLRGGKLLRQVPHLALGPHAEVTQASQPDALSHQPTCGHTQQHMHQVGERQEGEDHGHEERRAVRV